MKSDTEIALERVRSEAFGALMSIQSYRSVGPEYFDRLRSAVADAVTFFGTEPEVPSALGSELIQSAQVLRNEATAFPGRKSACLEMAGWLEAQAEKLARA